MEQIVLFCFFYDDAYDCRKKRSEYIQQLQQQQQQQRKKEEQENQGKIPTKFWPPRPPRPPRPVSSSCDSLTVTLDAKSPILFVSPFSFSNRFRTGATVHELLK
jgi:hypothetical protein